MFVWFRKRTPALPDAGRDKGSSQAEYAPPSGHYAKRECSWSCKWGVSVSIKEHDRHKRSGG